MIAEVVERGVAIAPESAGRGGSGRTPASREIVRSTAFTKPPRCVCPPVSPVHRIVDDRRRRHARQVEQLVGAEAQDLDDLRDRAGRAVAWRSATIR